MDDATLRERAGDLPREPGVYQFLDGDTVSYVGKAVDLRDRVRSYVDPRSERIRRMVRAADGVDVAVTDTETQALLLEANLIKRHAPRYNVRLKDDKSYPLVQVTAHEFPRVEVTRDPDDDATVFGPFTDKRRVDETIKAIREAYGIRGCSDHKFANRDRPCLDYEMGLCSAPCVDEISADAYAEDVAAAERFFAGEVGLLTEPLEGELQDVVEERAFERAANLRDRLAAVEAFHGGAATAVHGSGDDAERRVDVLGAVLEGESATVARLHSEDGKLLARTRHRLDAPREEAHIGAVLSAFLPQYYAERDLPDALLCSERPDDAEVLAWLEAEGVALRVPGAGKEARLVELALKNARRGVGHRDEQAALADALGIDRPERVEGFDVSHAQGRAAVGSNVLFVGGSPEKSGYRRKRLDGGNDDYANMRALVGWRAERALAGRDDRPDPDLLLVDGGPGQLDAASDALEDAGWDVPAVALAKAEEVVHAPGGEAYDWPDDAPQLHLCQRVRDEAHRFAVQYHQTLRDDVSTVLDEVGGVGPKTRRALLRRFGSLEGVRSASRGELLSVPGVGETTADALEAAL